MTHGSYRRVRDILESYGALCSMMATRATKDGEPCDGLLLSASVCPGRPGPREIFDLRGHNGRFHCSITPGQVTALKRRGILRDGHTTEAFLEFLRMHDTLETLREL